MELVPWQIYKYCIENEFQIFNSMMLDIGFLCCRNFVCSNLNIFLFQFLYLKMDGSFSRLFWKTSGIHTQWVIWHLYGKGNNIQFSRFSNSIIAKRILNIVCTLYINCHRYNTTKMPVFFKQTKTNNKLKP